MDLDDRLVLQCCARRSLAFCDGGNYTEIYAGSPAPRYDGKIETALTVYEQQGQVKVHTETGMLEFTSVTFDSGSAELTPKTKLLVKDLSENLIGYMAENPMLELLIEGHTDPAAIHAVINHGGYFEDNIQLSTLRAANVRKELLASMGKEYANRIGVAGYGDTRLKNTEQPVSPDNRRIEIRLLWKGQSAQ